MQFIRERRAPLKLSAVKTNPPSFDVEWLYNDPDGLCCPITLDLLKDPVVASDGFTYERAAIERVIRDTATSPQTRAKLTPDLRADRKKKAEVDKYRAAKAQDCLRLAAERAREADYVVANLLMERALQLNGGSVEIFLRWIPLLQAMGLTSKVVATQLQLGDEYVRCGQSSNAMRVFEELIDNNCSDEHYKNIRHGATENPLALHVAVVEKMIPLFRGDNHNRPVSSFRLALVAISRRATAELKSSREVLPLVNRVEFLLMASLPTLGESDELWNALAELQLGLEKPVQASTSFVNAARCCGLAGHSEAAEDFLNKAVGLGNTEAMLALIDLLRERETQSQATIQWQRKEIDSLKRLNGLLQNDAFRAFAAFGVPVPSEPTARRPASRTPPRHEDALPLRELAALRSPGNHPPPLFPEVPRPSTGSKRAPIPPSSFPLPPAPATYAPTTNHMNAMGVFHKLHTSHYAAMDNLVEAETLGRLCLETDEVQTRLALETQRREFLEALRKGNQDTWRACRARWLQRTQKSAEGLVRLVLEELISSERHDRTKIGEAEDVEWESILYTEEESWTRCNIFVIERAWRAYRFRRQVTARITHKDALRRAQTLPTAQH